MPKAKLFVLLSFLAMMLQSCGTLQQPDICNETLGRGAMADKNYDAAYVHLKGCENIENSSGEAIQQLSVLTKSGYGEYDSDKARHTKYYELVHRSALKLDPMAISLLIKYYKDGDKIIPQEPRLVIAQCLNALLNSGQGNRRQVLTCLSL